MVPEMYMRSEIGFLIRRIIVHNSINPDRVSFTVDAAGMGSRILVFQKCKANLGIGLKTSAIVLNTFLSRVGL